MLAWNHKKKKYLVTKPDAPVNLPVKLPIPPIESTQIPCDASKPPDHVLSKRRWLILISVCVFGVSLTIQNTSPVLKKLFELLDLEVGTFLYLDMILGSYMAALFAVPSGLLLDAYGIRVVMLAAAFFSVLSSVFSTLLYFNELPGWQHYKMYYYVMKQSLKTLCFAVFFLLPLKVSESWFSASERTMAWMIMITQLQIGSCFASFAWPRIVTTMADFRILAYVSIGGTTVTLITCLALVTRSEPPSPPSARAAAKKYSPIVPSLKRMFRRSDILLHSIHHSIGASIALTYSVVMTDILASIGLSQVFSGDYMLVNSLTSIVLSIIMSKFVHKVNNQLMACKIGSLCQATQFVVLLTAVLHSASGSVLICLSIVGVVIGTWNGPNSTEMTASLITGVVSESTITSFQLVSAPVLVSVVRAIFALLIEKHDGQNNYNNALLFLIALAIINEVYYQVFFHGKEPDGDDETKQSSPQIDEPTATS